MPTILLIRHGQACFGATSYDVLSEKGTRQVGMLRRSLAHVGVEATSLVTGSLRRQRESALPWTADAPEAAEIDPCWDEYDSTEVMEAHGDLQVSLESLPGTEPAINSPQFQEILDVALTQWVEAGSSGGARESWVDFQSRVLGALYRLASSLGSGETALVFTSGGVVAACTASLLDASDELFVTLNRMVVNSSVTKVLVGRRGLSLASYNEHGHLPSSLVTYR